MAENKFLFTCGHEIIIFLILLSAFQIHALIYRDFEENGSKIAFSYGILDIGDNLRMLSNRTDEKDQPFESFYVQHDSLNDTDKLAEICANYKLYWDDKKIFLRIDWQHLEFLADCLNTSSETLNKEQLQRLTVLAEYYNAQHANLSLQFSRLKQLHVKFGIIQPKGNSGLEPQEIIIKNRKLNLEITCFLSSFYVIDEIFFDYNSFAEAINIWFSSLMESISGFKNHIIIGLEFRGRYFAKATKHKSLILKFFYQWGEMGNHSIIYQLSRNDEPVSKPIICDGRITQPLMLTISDSGSEKDLKMYKTQALYKDFSSLLIVIDVFHELVYEAFLDLAGIHSKYPCQFSWNVRWQLEDKNDFLAQNIKCILTIMTIYPGLIKNHFLSVNSYSWRSRGEISTLKLKSAVHDLHTLSAALNESVILLTPSSNAGSMSDIDEFNYTNSFYEKYSNNSPGLLLTLLQSWKYDTVTPNFLIESTDRIEKLAQMPIQVEISSSWTVKKEEYGGCYQFKTYFNMLKNWAAVNSYNVSVTTFRPSHLFRYAHRIFSKAWFKNIDMFGDSYAFNTATAEELKFMSNLEDTCVAMPTKVPKAPITFNVTVSGTTIWLTSKPYLQLKPYELAELLKLVHFRFSAIQIVLYHPSKLNAIVKAIQLVKSDSETSQYRPSTTGYQYYLNIGSSEPTMFHLYDTFSGVHSTFCQCKNDTVTLRSLRNTLVRNIGISITYDEALIVADEDSWKEIVSIVDYTVIRVNLARALLMGPHIESFSDSLNDTFHHFINHRKYDILPNPVFDRIRATRLNMRRIKPNATVYIQIAWPTIENQRSIELTQRLWTFLRDFSSAFDFPFFLSESFDDSTGHLYTNVTDLKYGWWKLLNNSNRDSPMSYVDKQAAALLPEAINKDLKKTSSNIPTNNIVIGIAAVFLGIICAAFVVIYRLRQKLQMMLTKEELQQFEMGNLESNNAEKDYCCIAYNREKYEISKRLFDIDSSTLIGSGFFGLVYKSRIPSFDKPVAVKIPKINGKHELLSVLREIKVMSFVGDHENILKLVGTYTKEIQKGVVFVVTEFMENGSLLDHLRKMENLGDLVLHEFYHFCFEISKGMHYLSEKKVVHGDLSARNVLLDENNVCKICDFGLSRKLYDMDMYVKSSVEPVAWKWMSVETLERSELSLKSDIWSLGVTFWEIFSFGKEPYQSISWDLNFTEKLINGLRLPKPANADTTLYEKMLSCWNVNPDERPNAEDFIEFFRSLKSETYLNL